MQRHELTSPQRKAVNDALRLLRAANLPPETLLALQAASQNDVDTPELRRVATAPSVAIQKAWCAPTEIRFFTPSQRESGRVTRKRCAAAVVEHPEGSVIEYPEAGRTEGESIAHVFSVNPEDVTRPQQNIQFSLGGTHGAQPNMPCQLLRNPLTDRALKCRKLRLTCNGTKRCEFFDVPAGAHAASMSLEDFRKPWSAEREVFTKTLALFTTLREQGCRFNAEDHSTLTVRQEEQDETLDADDYDSDTGESGKDDSGQITGPCSGKMKMLVTSKGQTIIQCEHRNKQNRAHLRLSGLCDYDFDYLRALFDDDWRTIAQFEQKAKEQGYGPLMPCSTVVPASAKRQCCSKWHRLEDGSLDRGELHKDVKCDVTFDIYTPYYEDLQLVPKVVLICTNKHSHPPPIPVKTPPLFFDILSSFLVNLGWKLADATVRRVLLDTGFMMSLRTELGWTGIRDPVLTALHPSLGNTDHVKRIILDLREKHFTSGTGFTGAKSLRDQHAALASQHQYVRVVEEIKSSKEGSSFRIVICMNPLMSHYLINAKRVTIDTSFKRVQLYDEFEVETWLDNGQKSVVVCRAYITSQSAEAHLELFKRIFEIAERDTGQKVQFRYIHGEGYETWVLDGHRGQAQGLGKFCQWLSQDNEQICCAKDQCQLKNLDPYEHNRHYMRVCYVHYKRNIKEMGSSVPLEIKTLMLSIATCEPLPDFKGTLNTIRDAGKKPKAWLEDKLRGKFVFPGVYWPESRIPLEIWKASPATTNNNEQAHRNMNRDGTGLTLLAGIMRGLQYDIRAFEGIETAEITGIHLRDQDSTPHLRLSRSVARKAILQQRYLGSADEALKKIQDIVEAAVATYESSLQSMEEERLDGNTGGPAHRRLRKLKDTIYKAQRDASALYEKSSGSVMVDFDQAHEIMQLTFDQSPPRAGPSTPSRARPSSRPNSISPAAFVSPLVTPMRPTTTAVSPIRRTTESTIMLGSTSLTEQTKKPGSKRKERDETERTLHEEPGPSTRKRTRRNSGGLNIQFYRPNGTAHNYWRRA